MSTPTRTLVSIAFGFFASIACGQLANGSFEDQDGFNLSGWSVPFEGALNPVNEGAPGFGEWSIAVQSSHPIWTGTYWIAQQVNDLQPGDMYTLSFWVKCPANYFQCACVFVDHSPAPHTCGNSTTWNLVSLADTVSPSYPNGPYLEFRTTSDGLVGNTNPYPAQIDGVTLVRNGHVGTSELGQNRLLVFFDSQLEQLVVSTPEPILSFMIMDPNGRTLIQHGSIDQGSKVRFPVQSFATGFYFVIARTTRGEFIQKLPLY